MRDKTIAATVLHVNDCASTAARMISEAGRRGMKWDYLPLAVTGAHSWDTPYAKIEKAVRGVTWLGRLRLQMARHEFVHVHSIGTMRHARYAVGRYILHSHGTDVRTLQYDPVWRDTILSALRHAEAVFYPTPELHEHVLQHREDAVYLPIPLDPARLPSWAPRSARDGRPTVFFASRWGRDKGCDIEFDVAARLVAALGAKVDVVGLDWGPMADRARATGVRLVPPMNRTGYLATLASADVVVGQAAGILATSELETLGIGAPLVLPVPTPAYADRQPPVYGSSVDTAVDAVQGLVSGSVGHDPARGRSYIDAYHHIAKAVDVVVATYSRVRLQRVAIGQLVPQL